MFIFYFIVSNISPPAAGSRDWRTYSFSTILYRIFSHQQMDPGIGGHVHFLHHCIKYFHTSSWIQGLEDMFIFYIIVSNIFTPAAESRDWRTCSISTPLYRIFPHQQLDPGIGFRDQFDVLILSLGYQGEITLCYHSDTIYNVVAFNRNVPVFFSQ